MNENIIIALICLGILGITILFIWIAFATVRRVFENIGKFSENLSKEKGPRFVMLYRLAGIGVSVIFVAGMLSIVCLPKLFNGKPELQIAIEIVLYGLLWTMAIATFILGCHRIRCRLIIPGLLSCIIITGSIAYTILSKDSFTAENGMHFIIVSIALSGILLVKGFLGPIAMASSLSLAAYGLIHTGDYHVPLVQELVVFILNESSLTLEYLTSIILALGALANSLKMDFSAGDHVEGNF